ncbi:glutamine amidotransferase [Methylovirgula sp. 4M-Z18]|uniref:glutamine amidotransferase n=1 Tax=Methylovirgula sp. 4M-Z18 TaxID=2293567 RepID=UPI0026CE3C4E
MIVLHQEHSTAGRVGFLLRRMGFDLDIRRPRFGDTLPTDMADHAGAVVFGGPMSANDEDGYIRNEIDWLAKPLREDKPFLGLCLGAQMLTRHLGARVYKHTDGRIEAGYYPIAPHAAAHHVTAQEGAPFPAYVYQWHSEGFDLPRGATLLAEGDEFPIQAYRCGRNAYALQFHPEVTYAMICRWTTRGAERLANLGAQPPAAHFAGWYQYDAIVGRWIKEFLKVWLEPAT